MRPCLLLLKDNFNIFLRLNFIFLFISTITLAEEEKKLPAGRCYEIFSSLILNIPKILKKKSLVISPTVIFPTTALLLGTDVTTAGIAGIKLSFVLGGFNIVIEKMIEDSRKLFSPEKLGFIIAISTSLPELVFSGISAMQRSNHFYDVSSMALGSNWANVVLGTTALFAAMKQVAIKKNILKKGEKFNILLSPKILKSIDYKIMQENISYAIYFMSQALLYQYYIKAEIQAGNYLPLTGWVVINTVVTLKYFLNGTLKKGKLYKETIQEFNVEKIMKAKEVISQIEKNDKTEQSSIELNRVLNDLMKLKDTQITGNQMKKTLKYFKKTIDKNIFLKKNIKNILNQLNNKELINIFKYSKISVYIV